jgi:acyl-CoA hydrolase
MDKPVRESQVITTQLVLPNDTNQLGNLLGGTLMHWIDVTAAICAHRHAGRICVTASVDELDFFHPVHLGEIVTLKASVNRVFRTSMEVGVLVTAEAGGSVPDRRSHTAYLTFVSVDEDGNPVPVVQVRPETDAERRRFDAALARRERRLAHRRPEQH